MATSQISQAADSEEITLWISDDEDNNDTSFDFLQNLLGGDTESESDSEESDPLPPWKNRGSQINIKKMFARLKDEERWIEEMREEGLEEPGIVDDGYDGVLSWTHNFKSFKGYPLSFTGNPGPKISSTDPFTLFTEIWDKEIMELIVQETNRYVKDISKMQRGMEMPEKHSAVKWKDLTVDELYVYISLSIYMSLQKACFERIIFGENKFLIPHFPEIMSLERFQSLNTCLHFVDNSTLSSNTPAIHKIKPILDYCNVKFPSMYVPRQFLDVDDSLLLSKEGSAEGIRLQANNIGVRTYELSEVFTGYLLKVHQYSGSDADMGCKDKAEIVLKLVEDYSNKGHRVVTDRYFSSVYLARELRSKGFDSIGEVRKTRKDMPVIIQELKLDERDNDLYSYQGNKVRIMTRHCGDISVISWSEFDLTLISTYHSGAMRSSKRGVRRPALTLDYYKVKEKMSQRNEDLGEYVIMSKSTERWYVTLFKRLINCSIRNCYIIYKSNMGGNRCLSQNVFRYMLANQLLDRYGVKEDVHRARMISKSQNVENGSGDEDDDDSEWSDIDSDDCDDCSIM